MIHENKIQIIPVADSPNNDAFESIVELYFQLQGYITSCGKWFWYAEEGKQQRGYQDFDVLAINEEETTIVSVSSNLDDKIAFKHDGVINDDKLKNLLKFFARSEEYLKVVAEYKWLTEKERKIKRVVAYISFQKRRLEDIRTCLTQNNIELLASCDIVDSIIGYLDEHNNLKVQDQTLRMLQVLKYNGLFDKEG